LSPYPHLLAPGRIGTLELRNRILLCPMGDNLAHDDGSVSDRQLAYFEARARGGAALLLVGSVAVAYPVGSYSATQLAVSEDRYVDGLRALTERAHRHDARIAAQLVHDGPSSLYDIEQGRAVLVPSPPPRLRPDALSAMVTSDELTAMTRPFTAPGAAMTHAVADDDDIVEVIETFAAAAERAQAAGFDGIELHAGHGYLIDTFLSPYTNARDDRWGGDVAGRSRLLVEITRAVRARVGPDFPLWCRLNSREHHRSPGETIDDALATADLAVAAGLDALHVSAYADAGTATGITDAHTPHTPGALLAAAAAFKARFEVPIITFGRLEPDQAEQALADGVADFVAMGRKLLADPDLPRLLADDRADDVRPCIYQYRCIGNIFLGEGVRCAANAATAREHEHSDGDSGGDDRRAASPRRVLVVGGGPAGMEAAHQLARHGHDVELWEASNELGGLLRLGALTDEPLDRFLRWQIRQVEHADVRLELRRRATVDAIRDSGADHVVVATGARWERPMLRPPAGTTVRMVTELGPWLQGRDDAALGAGVVFLGGGKIGLSLAAVAAARGHQVTVVEPSGVFGVELGLPGRFRLVHDLREAGVALVSAPAFSGRDTVVVTTGSGPNPLLGDALADAGIEATSIGNCAAVRHIEGAMLDVAALVSSL
jgi:2,4-dienoyl-CoA reductase (NADPH2)